MNTEGKLTLLFVMAFLPFWQHNMCSFFILSMDQHLVTLRICKVQLPELSSQHILKLSRLSNTALDQHFYWLLVPIWMPKHPHVQHQKDFFYERQMLNNSPHWFIFWLYGNRLGKESSRMEKFHNYLQLTAPKFGGR